jgi:hypothetical protein
MISNLNTYSSLANLTSTSPSSSGVTGTSDVDNIIAKYKESTEKAVAVDNNQNSLYLSSKAQKINAISKEFFSGGSLNFSNIESLKERVYQLGLISKDEYARLTKDSSTADVSAAGNENSIVGLTDFMGDLITRLQTDGNEGSAEEPTESKKEAISESLATFIAALKSAKSMISNVEDAKRKTDFKTTLQTTIATLKATIEDPSFDKIPLDDKVGLSKVYQTLEIVDQLSPQRLNNEKINKYIDLSFR